MADWPLRGDGQRFEHHGLDLSTSSGIDLTAGTTKGSWVELIDPTLFDAQFVLVQLGPQGTAGRRHLVDIAVGASGSEQIIIPNLFWDAYDVRQAYHYIFYISIPAGSRIAGRAQLNTSSAIMRVSTLLGSQGFLPSSPLSVVKDYGTDLSNTEGTTVDPGATSNTVGAYVELVDVTERAISQLVLGIGQRSNASLTGAYWLVDFAVGASGSEQIIIPRFRLHAEPSADVIAPLTIGPFPVSIPAASRLAMRAQCSTNNSIDRLFDVIAYGVS